MSGLDTGPPEEAHLAGQSEGTEAEQVWQVLRAEGKEVLRYVTSSPKLQTGQRPGWWKVCLGVQDPAAAQSTEMKEPLQWMPWGGGVLSPEPRGYGEVISASSNPFPAVGIRRV